MQYSQRSYGHNQWHYVDIRLNPDGTYEILFWPRGKDQPTPLVIPVTKRRTKEEIVRHKGKVAEEYPDWIAENFPHPMPMIQRSMIRDPETAIKHAKILDIFFGSRERQQEPDYGELLEYLEEVSPPAWEYLTKASRAAEDNAEQPLAEPETAKPFELQSEVVEAPKPKPVHVVKTDMGLF